MIKCLFHGSTKLKKEHTQANFYFLIFSKYDYLFFLCDHNKAIYHCNNYLIINQTLSKMKKIIFAVLSFFVVLACQRLSTDDVASSTSLFPLQFNIELQKESVSFSSTKSQPANTIPEPEISSPVAESGNYTQIEYLVYQEGNDTPFKQRHYTDSDNDFGIVYDSLPKGNYQIAFLAHSSPNPVLSGDNTFSFDSISDTFFLLKELEVTSQDVVIDDVSLQRIVSRVEFISNDKIPNKLNQFDIKISGYPNQLAVLTQQGVPANDTVLLSKVFNGEGIGEKNTQHAFYSFIPPTGQKIGIKLNALNKEGEIYYSHTLETVPEMNKIIRYRGNLYSIPLSDESFTLEINNEWNEIVDKELGEE